MRRCRVGLALAVAIFASAGFAAQASAATYTVGTTTDLTACRLPPSSGTCSLRAIIAFENNLGSNHTPADTIVVPNNNGSTQLYDLTNGPLQIKQNVIIAGAGAFTTQIFQQTPSSTNRVFEILPDANAFLPTVTISGLGLFFGKADSTNGFFGGNVLNEGTLTLSEDDIEDGSASSGGGVSNNGGTLTLTHSLIRLNQANSGGADSGGIQNVGPNPSSGTAPTLNVDNSTISDNTSSLGGGIFSWCQGSNNPNGNPCAQSGTAQNAETITNSTIVNNNGGGRATNGGGLLVSSGKMTVRNSIVANNAVSAGASNCGSNPSNGATITSLGHNLESGTDCGFKSPGDLQSTDPKFFSGGIADNGGNTQTYALDARSPAVDAIPSGSQGCGGTDQRDVARPQGAACDIGAYELYQATEGHSFTGVIGSIEAGATPSIDWGDGTPQSGGATAPNTGQVTGSHTYADEGVYNGVIHYTNSDHNPSTRPFQLKVIDAPLSVAGRSISATKGTQFSGPVGSISDSNPDGKASDFTAAINWGDGSTSAGTITGTGGSFTVNGTHTYSTVGTFPTSVAVADIGGSRGNGQGTASVSSPPGATALPPSVSGGNTAGFSAQVNPEGSATSAHWEYGLDPSERGPGFTGNQFDQSTAPQAVGSDFSSHPVSAQVTNLQPNALYHVRLVATNAAGDTFGPDQTFTTPKAPAPPPPVLGKTVNLTPSGTVFVLMQGQFVKLTQTLQLPSGTVIDALHGSISLVAAGVGGGLAHDAKAKKGKKKPKPFTGTFGGAVFSVTQAKSGPNKGQTTLSLVESGVQGAPSYASCKAKGAGDQAHAALSSRILQTLRSRSSGRFRTRGRYAAGTVRGTKWTTTDRCDGTLIAVQVHSVLVTDLVKHKTVLVRAGHHYLAKAPSPKRHK